MTHETRFFVHIKCGESRVLRHVCIYTRARGDYARMTVLIAYVCMLKFNYVFNHVIAHVRFFSSRGREFVKLGKFLLKLYIKGFTIRENLHLGKIAYYFYSPWTH